MQQTIKLSTDGSDQLVRLTDEFRLDGEEVLIRKDTATGAVILTPREKNFEEFFRLRDQLTQEERDVFVIPQRGQAPLKPRKLF